MKIINKIKLAKEGLVVKGTKRLVHLRQGDIDGACAVYSMVMCLLMTKAVTRNEISLSNENPDGRESVGRLIKTFMTSQGLLRKGYFLDKLVADLQHAYKRKISTEYFHQDDNGNLLSAITAALDAEKPVEIGFSYKRGGRGHAIAVIGYNKENDSTLLFCLDPGYPIPDCMYWNNVLCVEGNKIQGYNTYNHLDKAYVFIDETIAYEKPTTNKKKQ